MILFEYFDSICHGQKATDFGVANVLIKKTYQISHCVMFPSTWPIMKTPWKTTDDFDCVNYSTEIPMAIFFSTEIEKDHVQPWIPFLHVISFLKIILKGLVILKEAGVIIY